MQTSDVTTCVLLQFRIRISLGRDFFWLARELAYWSMLVCDSLCWMLDIFDMLDMLDMFDMLDMLNIIDMLNMLDIFYPMPAVVFLNDPNILTD